MDDFFFEEEMRLCDIRLEATHSLEILNYSVSARLEVLRLA